MNSFDGRILSQMTIDGKLMGLPSTAIGGQHDMLWIRKDWLEKVGGKVPTTQEEVVQLAQTFKEKDLAGGGKTVGLISSPEVAGGGSSMNVLFYANHAYPREWIKKDGKQAYGSIQPETKTALAKIRDLYKAGTLDKQFPVRSDTEKQALISNGQTGIVFGPWWYPYSSFIDTFTNNRKSDWIAASAPTDSAGKLNVPDVDPVANIIVVRKGYAHPEAIIKSINVSNDFVHLNTKEDKAWAKSHNVPGRWSHLLVQIPGQWDYNNAIERVYTALMKTIKDGGTDANTLPEVVPYYQSYEKLKKEGPEKVDPYSWSEVTARVTGEKAAIADNINPIAVTFFDKTPTMLTKWATLKKMEDEMYVKVVTGEEPLSAFDDFVTQWKKLGGDQITKEVNDAVAKKKG